MSNIAFLFLPLAFCSLPAVLPFVSPSSQVVSWTASCGILTYSIPAPKSLSDREGAFTADLFHRSRSPTRFGGDPRSRPTPDRAVWPFFFQVVADHVWLPHFPVPRRVSALDLCSRLQPLGRKRGTARPPLKAKRFGAVLGSSACVVFGVV